MEKKKKKKKKKNTDPMSKVQQLPYNYDENSGEIGTGISAGELESWGFGSFVPDEDNEPEYEDDDFEDDDEPPTNQRSDDNIKKKKQKGKNGLQ